MNDDQSGGHQEATDNSGPELLDRALASLTDEQRLSVDSPAAALCIVAGAGSGKTRVLTLRAARRIADGSAEADHTAIFTFTRKAAHELRQRLGRYGVAVSSPTGDDIPSRGVRAGTLHQLALALIRRHALDVGHPPPVVAEHRFRMVCDIVGDPALASAIDAEIGWAKANCLTAESYRGLAEEAGRPAIISVDQVVDGYAAYEAGLQRRRMVDLDDLLIRAGDLLQSDAAFAERIQWRYRHLSVDEFQDVNPAAFRLIRALMGDVPDLSRSVTRTRPSTDGTGPIPSSSVVFPIWWTASKSFGWTPTTGRLLRWWPPPGPPSDRPRPASLCRRPRTVPSPS